MFYCQTIVRHYEQFWSARGESRVWNKGPTHDLPEGFHVLRFQPRTARAAWTYATVCMSHPNDRYLLELHLHSPVEDESHVELLTAIAHYHRTGRSLGLGHTVNFGRPWLPGSACTHGLISLPYLDGPKLEMLQAKSGTVACLWLVPITEREVEFKKQNGLEVLEEQFETKGLDYLSPGRPSLV